ncbi:MAG: hypothetical protein Kow0069_24180 [Promethearchaeota archaeon]
MGHVFVPVPERDLVADTSAKSFLPVHGLAFLRTLAVGVTSGAVSNLLVLELGRPGAVAGVVVGANAAGFVASVAIWGNLAEKRPRRSSFATLQLILLATAFAKYLPLDDAFGLITFTAAYTVEGSANGLFWPVQQSYASLAAERGDWIRDRYIAGYNLGWNAGFIAGYASGVLLVFVTGSNYWCFHANLFCVVLAFPVLSKVAPDGHFRPPPVSPEHSPAGPNSPSNPSPRPVDPHVALVFATLLVHSYADGASRVLVPLKVEGLGFRSWTEYSAVSGSSASFAFSLVKAFSQTATSYLGPRLRESLAKPVLASTAAGVAACWALFGATNWTGGAYLAMGASGACQGVLYATGMKVLTSHSQRRGSTKIFAHFQFTMGLGRAVGPVVSGFVADWSFAGAVWTVSTFGFVAAAAWALGPKRSNLAARP